MVNLLLHPWCLKACLAEIKYSMSLYYRIISKAENQVTSNKSFLGDKMPTVQSYLYPIFGV
jgi:hypothetical protein